MDEEEYCYFRVEWFLCCGAEMKHLSAFSAVGPLQRKKLRIDEIDISSCNEETFGSAHRCSVIAIAEGKLGRRFGTICNVRLIRDK